MLFHIPALSEIDVVVIGMTSEPEIRLFRPRYDVESESEAPVTRYRIRIGAISILIVFQSCLLLKLFIFDVFV